MNTARIFILIPLGRIVATPGVLEACTRGRLDECPRRHMHGDWGCVSAVDAAENELSLLTDSGFFRPIRSIQPGHALAMVRIAFGLAPRQTVA